MTNLACLQYIDDTLKLDKTRIYSSFFLSFPFKFQIIYHICIIFLINNVYFQINEHQNQEQFHCVYIYKVSWFFILR